MNTLDYKQIIIGPSLIFTEHILLGYPLEACKILKQNTGKPYPKIVKNMISKGISRGLYTSYIPHGFLQTFKGAPLLFGHSSTKNLINKYFPSYNNETVINCYSGIVGGALQGFFITPLQRSRTIVTTNNDMKKSSTEIIKNIIKKQGVKTIFKGLEFTMTKRSLDWGIRFAVQDIIQKKILLQKKELTLTDKLLSGLGAGFISCVTTPIDVAIAISQGYTQKNESSLKIIKKEYKNKGIQIFLRGGGARILHSSYHVGIVLGLKTVYEDIYNKI